MWPRTSQLKWGLGGDHRDVAKRSKKSDVLNRRDTPDSLLPDPLASEHQTLRDIETHLHLSIGSDGGVYNATLPWYMQLIYEIGVYNEYFRVFSSETLKSCMIHRESIHKSTWNRSIQVLNLLSRNTASYMLLAVLMTWQLPADNGTCVWNSTEALCHSYSPHLAKGIHYCKWNTGKYHSPHRVHY